MAEYKPLIDEPINDETKGLLTSDVTPESPAPLNPSESNGVAGNLFYRFGRSRIPAFIIPCSSLIVYYLLRLAHIEMAYEWAHLLLLILYMAYILAMTYAGVLK
ncbi:hypothetical protein VPNG_08856 [Cytospora leucostoma]|uniref:Uncharacterized protein n=1 Tax=Cytospora leucostoma TaxID=1230097 RepID=A0A423VRR8_9PEZI|nr:hypothetical protein VPNG_08856 [Cytospora leucostoma]